MNKIINKRELPCSLCGQNLKLPPGATEQLISLEAERDALAKEVKRLRCALLTAESWLEAGTPQICRAEIKAALAPAQDGDKK